MVEREMRVTLACRLRDAVGEIKQFKGGMKENPQAFIDWCDKYQVRFSLILKREMLFVKMFAAKYL